MLHVLVWTDFPDGFDTSSLPYQQEGFLQTLPAALESELMALDDTIFGAVSVKIHGTGGGGPDRPMRPVCELFAEAFDSGNFSSVCDGICYNERYGSLFPSLLPHTVASSYVFAPRRLPGAPFLTPHGTPAAPALAACQAGGSSRQATTWNTTTAHCATASSTALPLPLRLAS